jgi:hypothetical protein
MLHYRSQNPEQSMASLRESLTEKGNGDLAQKITDNLVRIVTGKFECTGLLLTCDGFILTAYHGLHNSYPGWARTTNYSSALDLLRLAEGKHFIVKGREKYPLDILTYEMDKDHDLAIIKAVMREEPSPINYKIAEPSLNQQIRLYAMKDKELSDRREGRIIGLGEELTFNNIPLTVKDMFRTDALASDGFSGGIVADQEGAIVGVITHSFNLNGEKEGRAGAADINYAISLAHRMSCHR